jgi:L,D-peptidoglycan transpeptidase YkuD (ErfK/YbiS/YcfS/YnhG family)
MNIVVTREGQATYRGKTYACIVGKSGISRQRQEGDGTTPSGVFQLLRVHYRTDRVPTPATELPLRVIAPNDGWSIDSADPKYNSLVTLPHPFATESLWRNDTKYDLLLELDFNQNPSRPGLGSAIFMHVKTPGQAATLGCVALDYPHLAELIGSVSRHTKLEVRAE